MEKQKYPNNFWRIDGFSNTEGYYCIGCERFVSGMAVYSVQVGLDTIYRHKACKNNIEIRHFPPIEDKPIGRPRGRKWE